MPPATRRSVWAFVLLAAVFAAILGVSRVEAFKNLELGDDQSFQIHWARQVVTAERWLPRSAPGTPFIDALTADEDCVLNAVLAPIYGSHELLLSVGDLAWLSVAGLAFGANATILAAAAIAAHWIALFLVAVLPVATAPPHLRGQAAAIGAVAFTLCAASGVLQVVSTMGGHNVGLMTMMVAAIFCQRWLNALERRGGGGAAGFAWGIGAQTAALYSYHVAIFILPAAVALAAATAGRWRPLARYVAAGVASLLPVAALVAITALTGGSKAGTQGRDAFSVMRWAWSEGGGFWIGLPERAARWFETLGGMVSVIGLLAALLGVVLLARRGFRLPLAIVAAHFAAFVLVPAFAEMHTRTNAYVVPFLFLGIGGLVVGSVAALRDGAAARRPAGIAGVAIGGLAAVVFLVREVPQTVAEVGARESRLSARAHPAWPDFVRGIETAFPSGAVIIPETPTLRYRISANLAQPRGAIVVFRPIQVLAAAKRQGVLQHYVRRRGLTLAPDTAIGVVASPELSGGADRGDLPDWLGPKGLGVDAGARLEIARRSPAILDVVLYRVAPK